MCFTVIRTKKSTKIPKGGNQNPYVEEDYEDTKGR
jgi:hypothetical protein